MAAEGRSGCGMTWRKPELHDAVEGRWEPTEKERLGGIRPELRWKQCRSQAWGRAAASRSVLSSCTVVVAAGFDDCRGVILRVSMPPGARNRFDIRNCAARAKPGEALICGAPVPCKSFLESALGLKNSEPTETSYPRS